MFDDYTSRREIGDSVKHVLAVSLEKLQKAEVRERGRQKTITASRLPRLAVMSNEDASDQKLDLSECGPLYWLGLEVETPAAADGE